MSERIPGSWKDGATAAVFNPYPKDVVGGVSDICRAENDFLNSHGFQSVEVTPRKSQMSPSWENSQSISLGVAVHANPTRLRTDAWWARSDPTELRKLFTLSTRNFLDIHEPAMYMPAYFVAFIRRLQWLNPHLVALGTLHADASEKHLLKFRLADEAQNTFHLMDAGIVNTYEMKAKYEKVLKAEFEVVENPVDTRRFNPNGPKLESFRDINLLDGKTNIVYVGRLEKRKGLDTALKAISVLLKDPNAPNSFRFLIAGSGPDEPKLHQIAEDLNLSDHVIFMGRISEEDKPKLYRSATFCYFPSELEESFGNVLLEAMASAKPVLAGIAYSNRLVKHGQNGFSLISTEPVEAAYYLAKMTRESQWLQNIGLEAHKFAQQFDTEIIFGKRLAIAYRIHEQKMKKRKL